MASVGWLVCGFEVGGEGLVDRIHWGSSVTISPGVTIPFPPNRARFAARASEAMSTSPSESTASSSDEVWYAGAAGAGGSIEIAIVICISS